MRTSISSNNFNLSPISLPTFRAFMFLTDETVQLNTPTGNFLRCLARIRYEIRQWVK